MNSDSIKKTAGVLLCVSLFAYSHCHLLKKEEPGIIRIIDSLSKKNILESPLKNIIEKFNLVEENISREWKKLPGLSSQEQQTWGASSRYPILGHHASQTPESITLIKDGEELEYLSGQAKQQAGWRWIATAERLDLRPYQGFDPDRRGVVISPDNSLRFEKFLPEGEVIFDLYVVNPDWKKSPAELLMTFNGSVVEELTITRKKWYRIRQTVSLGQYLIEFKLAGKQKSPDESRSVILGQVKIAGSSDIVLFSQSSQRSTHSPSGHFIFQYYTHAPLPDKKIKPVRPDIHYLYNFKHKFPLLDAGVEANVSSIKKKIVFDEYSLNALASPPPSEFALEVNIPQHAVLDFGYGILNEFRNLKSEKRIRFRVGLQDSTGENILFEKQFSWDEYKELRTRKIDLTPYSGRTVTLTFLTDEVGPKKDGYTPPPIVPVWVNPVIYQSSEKKQANIVLISLDTLRPDHLSCYGYHRETSQSIDSLAQDGVLFKNTYSTTSWTLPAHISMLTGLECFHHQVYFPLQKMDQEINTLANTLRTRHFYCAAFTGGGYLSQNYGFSKGFDAYHEIKLHGDKAIRFDEAERLAELATDWLENNQNKKFFLFLHTYQPHDPYSNLSSVGKDFLSESAQWKQLKMESLFEENGRFGTAFTEKEKHNIIGLYDGEIKYTDSALVRPMMEKLKELGLYENTLVIITSDHGEEFYDHEAWLHDHSIYNEGIKIPLIIKFPRSSYRGLRIDHTARITDIMPTILDIMDVPMRKGTLDGRSLLPLMKGKEKKQRVYISDLALRKYDFAPTLIAMNKDSYKLILNKKILSPYVKRKSQNFNGARIELYDVEKDPGETTNLASNRAFQELCFELINAINQIYEQAEYRKKDKNEVTLDQSLRERLKALGYIK